MWSAPLDWRRALAGYAGLAAEAVAAIVIGFMIMVLVVMLNPSLARGVPIADGCVRGEGAVVGDAFSTNDPACAVQTGQAVK